MMAIKTFGANTYGYVFNTIQKWSSIPTGPNAFFEVYQGIKKHDRRFGDMTIMYSIQLHGKRGAPKSHTQYMHGCFITYSRFKGELKISKVNHKSKCFVAMLRTSHQYGAEFAEEQQREEKRSSVSKLQTQKRVLKNYHRW